MQREIKFRAWDEDNGMTQVEMLYFGKDGNLSMPYVENLMQFTGLIDKAGKEIYVGDCFGEQPVGKELELIGTVIFDNDFSAFCVKYVNGGWSYLWEHLNNKKNHCEVIGNVWQNPELLSPSLPL